jgi:hypothetical protein
MSDILKENTLLNDKNRKPVPPAFWIPLENPSDPS